jgi:hypothetical protein
LVSLARTLNLWHKLIMSKTFSKLCNEHGVTMTWQEGAPALSTFPKLTGYICQLEFQGRKLETPFYHAHNVGPRAEMVLEALFTDAQLFESYPNIDDFADYLEWQGRAKISEIVRAFEACKAMAPKLREFLGDEFETFAQAAED